MTALFSQVIPRLLSDPGRRYVNTYRCRADFRDTFRRLMGLYFQIGMNEQQRDTAFLTRLISYDDSAERRDLAQKILRTQSDERCVRRAVWLMVLFGGLATAGLCYAAVFLLEPMNISQFLDQ